jgi:LacI family repressor for deo operon, udp, cdd, tsx, nupC, and nupG
MPDAICATTDNVAIGIMKKLYEKNIRIPQDVLLAGFDDISMCQYVSPSLTSVAQPREQMARFSTELLIRMISGQGIANRHVLLQPTLSIRDSTVVPTSINRKAKDHIF